MESRKPRPYADAPRLPDADDVDVRTLARGDFVELEVGPGRGGFLFERAEAEPRAALIGLEVRRKWATLVDQRLAKRGLGERARVFAEDAKLALARLGPAGSVKRVFLHFPDPWWKKRHQKRLVMGDVFVDSIARLLEQGGELYIQTDVEDRAAEYEARLLYDLRFSPAGDEEGSPRMAENPYGARSPREHRAIADGLPVFRMRWRKATAGS
jgi:tRNA (guanine-N7-)-methyltransferase